MANFEAIIFQIFKLFLNTLPLL